MLSINTSNTPSMPARNYHSERGAAMVEFSLVAPLLLLTIFAFFEFVQIAQRKLILDDAVRSAGRYLATLNAGADCQTETLSVLEKALSGSGIQTELGGFSGSYDTPWYGEERMQLQVVLPLSGGLSRIFGIDRLRSHTLVSMENADACEDWGN